MRNATAILTLATSLLLQQACFAGSPDDYLTKDGQLTGAMEVLNMQGGFAGFTGRFWKVEPSGEWTRGTVAAEKEKVEAHGKLTKEELALLVEEFVKFDLANLPANEGKPEANPHMLTLKFGKSTSVLTLKAGAGRPGAKAGAAGDVAERFLGIRRAVNNALEAKPEKPADPPK